MGVGFNMSALCTGILTIRPCSTVPYGPMMGKLCFAFRFCCFSCGQDYWALLVLSTSALVAKNTKTRPSVRLDVLDVPSLRPDCDKQPIQK